METETGMATVTSVAERYWKGRLSGMLLCVFVFLSQVNRAVQIEH